MFTFYTIGFAGDVDCSGNITVEGDDKEICTGDAVDIEVVASEPGAVIVLNTIDNPNVTGETLTGTFPNSIASFTDVLVNLGPNVEEVIYVFYARGANSICKGPDLELKVTVYPNLEVLFDPAYVCEGTCGTISPNVSGVRVITFLTIGALDKTRLTFRFVHFHRLLIL